MHSRRGSGVQRRSARIGTDMHPVEQPARRRIAVSHDHPNCNNKNSSVSDVDKTAGAGANHCRS
jgi:hypothetical protein